MPVIEPYRVCWRKNVRLSTVLLGLWLAVTFGVSCFARELSISFFGWPFSFWRASQGALLVYLSIVGFYAKSMNELDRLHGFAEED